MGCYIEFLILKEKILEIAGEEISMPVTVLLKSCITTNLLQISILLTIKKISKCIVIYLKNLDSKSTT